MRLLQGVKKGILLCVTIPRVIAVRMLLAVLPALLAAQALPKVATEAQETFSQGKYLEAAALYRNWAAAEPGSGPALAGVVRSLLYAGRKPEAYEALAAAQKVAPESSDVLLAAGDVAFRQGNFRQAETSYKAALQKEPKSTPAWMGLVRLFNIASAHQSAERTLKRALEINPNNRVFLNALAALRPDGPEHIAVMETLMGTFPADSESGVALREHIERDKKRGDRRRRGLASPYQAARIPIEIMRDSPTHFRGWGLKLSINDNKPLILMLDTGASGIVLNDKAAASLGLERENTHNFEIGGIGGGKKKAAHREIARKVDIGGVVFNDYPIEIVEGKVEEDAGLIGTDVFAQFLVTVDLPGEHIGLTPFPGLQTAPDPDAPSQRTLSAATEGFFPFYRIGHFILVPTKVSDKGPFLFAVDSGARDTILLRDVAAQVGKVKADNHVQFKGVQGKTRQVYEIENAVLEFAGIRQRNAQGVTVFDGNDFNIDVGTDLGGMLGARALIYLSTTIDYRNGLIKFEFKQK
jgi:tetratricopeptide (TPR) repeat protein